MRKKAALHNLGCKVNAYETEAMRQLLEEAGYEIVPFEPGADVYVINTCTVTNIADRKSRQMLHRARKMCIRDRYPEVRGSAGELQEVYRVYREAHRLPDHHGIQRTGQRGHYLQIRCV